MGPIPYLEAEKITFSPKPDGRAYGRTHGRTDGRTDRWTDRRMDISSYRVASLLKTRTGT